MSSISTAVGLDRKSRVSAYKLEKQFFNNQTGNLPQRIAVFGEANFANQIGLDTEPYEFTSAVEVGERYGFGSPLHQIARILRPVNQDGIGGIPTVAFPQKSDTEAVATSETWEVSGNAIRNATHSLIIAGRRNLDFTSYSYTVVKGDNADTIATKMADAVNGVLNTPVTAMSLDNKIVLTTKWVGKTSSELKTRIDTDTKDAGLSYTIVQRIEGAGGINLNEVFEFLGDTWYTGLINPYGEDAFEALEQFNGSPDLINPTGRYEGITFKPFMAFSGSSKSDKDDLALITDNSSRVDQVTNVLCTAPRSEGFSWEIAANYVLVFARVMQDTPHLDVNAVTLPDLPVPDNSLIGDMGYYGNRDFLVKKGCSTVILENGNYIIQDLVTTYHPKGESPLQFSYCRNLNLDWNVSYAYRTLEDLYVKDHVMVLDNQVTDAQKSIKPKEWKAVIFDMFKDLAQRALINDPEFSKKSMQVAISVLNPDRFESSFRYKRTGVARIEATTAQAGF